MTKSDDHVTAEDVRITAELIESKILEWTRLFNKEVASRLEEIMRGNSS